MNVRRMQSQGGQSIRRAQLERARCTPTAPESRWVLEAAVQACTRSTWARERPLGLTTWAGPAEPEGQRPSWTAAPGGGGSTQVLWCRHDAGWLLRRRGMRGCRRGGRSGHNERRRSGRRDDASKAPSHGAALCCEATSDTRAVIAPALPLSVGLKNAPALATLAASPLARTFQRDGCPGAPRILTVRPGKQCRGEC